MTAQIKVPPTIERAQEALGGIERLLHARQWERAAIVWAFTEDQQGQRLRRKTDEVLSITEFAKLGIAGLRTRETVIAYRACWRRAMDDAGAPSVKPGATIPVPELEWQFPADGRHETRYVEKAAQPIARAIARGDIEPAALAQELSDESVLEIVEQLLTDRPDLVFDAVGDLTTERQGSGSVLSFDERCGKWISQANTLFVKGARLVEEAENSNLVLGPHAEMVLDLVRRLTERQLDAEIRQFFESTSTQ